MDETTLIARHFAPLTTQQPGAEGLLNDAASLEVPNGKKLVITTDSVIEGWHLLGGATPEQIAQKLMRRNLSDLAAMGAEPWCYSLNCNIPDAYGEHYVEAFAREIGVLQAQYGCTLIGGDTTFQGSVGHFSMTTMGLAHATHSRSGAQIGDEVYVTGCIGDAGLALMVLQNKDGLNAISDDARRTLLKRYYEPEPRLKIGQALHGLATSVIDISDGLIQDLERIAAASDVSMQLEKTRIPLSEITRLQCEKSPELFDRLIDAGDDYELAFTAPKNAAESLATCAQKNRASITRVGEVVATSDQRVRFK